MSWVLVSAGNAPPEDKPFLISTVNQLEADKEELEERKQELVEGDVFPGRQGTLAEKHAWANKIANQRFEDHNWGKPDPDLLFPQIFFDCCPANVKVEILIDRDSVEKFKVLDSDLEQFLKLPSLWTGGNEFHSLEDFKSFIKSDSGTVLDNSVLLASKEVSKEEKLDSLISDMLGPVKGRLLVPRTPEHYWGLNIEDVVGRNAHFPNGKGGSSVAFRLFPRTPSEDAPPPNEFLEGLKKQKKETRKSYFLHRIPKEEESEDEDEDRELPPMSAENTKVIWMTENLSDEIGRVRGHIAGEGETSELIRRLAKGNTDTGNLKISIFEAEIDYAKRRKNYQEKLCSLVAIIIAFAEDCYWINDNEMPEEIQRIMQSLANYLRGTLFKKTDAQLGLGIESENSGASREGLYMLLEWARKEFESASEYCNFRLNFKPGKPRKKRKRQEQSDAQKRQRQS